MKELGRAGHIGFRSGYFADGLFILRCVEKES